LGKAGGTQENLNFMKTTFKNLLAALFIALSIQIHAQGFIYDQQSATSPATVQQIDGFNLQEDSPLTQSFIPTLSAIGFIQFQFFDISGNGNNGATVYVNLWIGSPNTNLATFLGSTTPVYMPNGFGNNGFSAGVTNFYFQGPITLTPSQTYYLQPVVLSGDDPWDIVVLTNTYPNGQLFANGFPLQPGSDFWFREGVVAVPEPSALALVGLSSLLFFVFKRRSKLIVLLLLITPLISYAQDSVVQATAENAGLASVSATALPRTGTFWVLTTGADGKVTSLPYPMLPPELLSLPIYQAADKTFIVDDTGGRIATARMSRAQSASLVQAQAQGIGDLITLIQTNAEEANDMFQPDAFMINTNGLWLEALNAGSNNVLLRLHNAVIGDNYQLLCTSNLLSTNWNLGQITNASDIEIDYSPALATNAMTFYRAHHANPVMGIYNNSDSEELDPTNTSNPGYSGSLFIYNEGSATNDVTVYYRTGGTAQNGIDYSNLTGSVIIPVNQNYAYIYINPLADGLKPNQTVILTLLQNTNYLIDPTRYSATNNLTANPQVYPIAFGDTEPICPNTSKLIQLNATYRNGLTPTFTILTYPAHGTLDTNSIPSVTYTPTNCYEGQDSFTFEVSDGQYTSTPATVTLIISDPLYANPFTAQTCRGASVGVALNGGDNCGEQGYFVSTPHYGTITNVSGQPSDPDYIYTPNGTNFTGTDTFNYIVYNDCGDAITNTVTITIGDVNFYPNYQTLITAQNQFIPFTLSAVDNDSCMADTNYYTYTIISGPTNGILSGTPPDITYTPNTNYEGIDSFQFIVNDGVWTSSVPATVTIFTTSGPTKLTAQCRSNSIVLFWTLPDWIAQTSELSNSLSGFNIYRATNPSGPFTLTNTVNNPDEWLFVDSNVVSGITYYYKVSYIYANGSYTFESPFSNIASSGTCNNPPYLGPIDVAFIVDDTISIWDSSKPEITNGIAESLSYINAASGGDYRVALVTPDNDIVNVRLGFTNNISMFMTNLYTAGTYGYDGRWESTDECLNTIANALTQTNRTTPPSCNNPLGESPQINNFTPVFRTNAVKLVVLITDAPPGSFCETLDLTRVHQYALDATTNHIHINAIHVYHSDQDGPLGIVQTVMQDYAGTSCGWYSHLTGSPTDGDIKNAVLNMLYTPGACY
jgi:hypothetical protein